VTRPRDLFVQGSKIETTLPSWRYPRFSHSAVDDVPLNSLASWARKRSQVLARHARLNRRQPHGRTTSGALRTLVLRVEHGLLLRNQRSARRPGFAGEPTSSFGFEGVRCNDADLNVITPGAFEYPLLEANWPRRNALQHHFGLAMRTAKALNSDQG
jgi:hypothetical protein